MVKSTIQQEVFFADWIDLFAYDEVNDRHVIAAIYRHETGVSVIDDWDGFGQKTTGSGTLKVHQVHLPASHLIPFDQRFKYQTAFLSGGASCNFNGYCACRG